jgi:hypothetical protein
MIHTTRAELLNCMLCGETAFGPAGASICMNCIADASHCFDCSSEVTVTVYPDETVTLDVEHADGCPTHRAA